MYGIIKTLGMSMRGADIFITVYEHSEVYSEEGGEFHRCSFQSCAYSDIRFSSFSYSSSFSSSFFIRLFLFLLFLIYLRYMSVTVLLDCAPTHRLLFGRVMSYFGLRSYSHQFAFLDGPRV